MIYNRRAMIIRVNGQDREVPESSSVSSLLEMLKLSADRVAVEVNRRLLKAEKYGLSLKGGDEIEIVTFVGGG